jgi:AcrR family transcriptional regulator
MATKRTTKAGSRASGSATGDLRKKILTAFATHWSEEGHAPRSVSRFCKELVITEAVFYKHFPSLHAVEKALWRDWISSIITAMEEGDDWEEFSARERYLAFLFALTQSAVESRSLLLGRFHDISPLAHPAALEGLRTEFLEFAHRIVDRGLETGEIADRRGLTGLYPGILYIHLRWVIDQYLKDKSEGFERTDAFIEKTVTLAFDLFRSQALDSAADLLRFLLPGNPWNGCSGKRK